MCDNKFEATKQELTDLEEFAAIKDNPIVKSTILYVLKLVPVLGELLDSSMDASLTHFQEKKRKELIGYILSNDNITSEQVNDVEFIMNFAKTLEAVNRLATNDKVKFFANLLKNSYFTDDKTENDEFEENIDILSRLSNREIQYMLFLYEYQKDNSQKEDPYFKGFGKKFSIKFNVGEFDYLDIYPKLTHTGFIQTLYKTNKPTITQNAVHSEFDEEFTVADIEIDIDYFWATDLFIKFAKRIGESHE